MKTQPTLTPFIACGRCGARHGLLYFNDETAQYVCPGCSLDAGKEDE